MQKSYDEQIANKNKQIEQLKNQKNQLMQKQKKEERAKRTNRLCKRHGMLEKYMPELINISDEQFEVFIKRAIDTDFGRSRLAEIVAKVTASTSVNPQNGASVGGG